MKILMLCNTNTSLSPLAEGILKHKLAQKNIKNVEVDSAGFESHLIGDNPDPSFIDIAKENNIDISKNLARLFSSKDYEKFDKIFVMNVKNYRSAEYFATSDDDLKKIDYLMNFISAGKNEQIPDPYSKKVEGIQDVYKIIEQACDNIVLTISEQADKIKDEDIC